MQSSSPSLYCLEFARYQRDRFKALLPIIILPGFLWPASVLLFPHSSPAYGRNPEIYWFGSLEPAGTKHRHTPSSAASIGAEPRVGRSFSPEHHRSGILRWPVQAEVHRAEAIRSRDWDVRLARRDTFAVMRVSRNGMNICSSSSATAVPGDAKQLRLTRV